MRAAVALTIGVVASEYVTPEIQFENFVQKYNKNYRDDAERQARFEIFKQNLAEIDAKNVEEMGKSRGDETVTYGVNSLSDLTSVEFKRNYLGLQVPATMRNLSLFVPQSNGMVPSSIDWVSKGAVTPVKNQGQCGSCWTFSTTGAIEGAWQIATGHLVSLSEQQIVDCATSAGQGCGGGWPSRAIQWEESQGICGENEYRYTARNGQCHTCASPVLARGSVTGVRAVSASIHAMKAALAETPVSVCVDAEQWSYYTGGIYSNCGYSLDHAVLAVGYDSSSWKVKNSWGTGWGERGYIRLKLGDTCGVLDNAVVALVSGSSSTNSGNIWDEIKKVVCQVLESGMPTHEVEDHICKTLKYDLEVTACDKGVELLVAKIESGALHCPTTVVV